MRIDCLNALKILIDVVSNEILSTMCDCMVMSGGIDTSFIAAIARRFAKIPLKGIIVGLQGSVASDLYWGGIVARSLGIEPIYRVYSVQEALRATDSIVSSLDTFDPVEVRNDVSVYMALEEAKKAGCKCVYTGDAGDELFAGYSYMHLYRLEELSAYIKDLSTYMEFSSTHLGRELGIKVYPPLASKNVVELAIEIPVECKISSCSLQRGKDILRSLLEDLSIQSSRRAKEPIEKGSGSVVLSQVWVSLVTDDMIARVSKIIKPVGKDQAYLVARYLELRGEPTRASGADVCKRCGGRMRRGYCKRCGYYEKK
ncbi:MAG: asparagine synthase-related protein [Desulfurococcales archaeon]|jgi:asparagine synthase (glutamine-hydrolysing)|nr:asparagine synthase-related protein [Desulfurococcales archaeon]